MAEIQKYQNFVWILGIHGPKLVGTDSDSWSPDLTVRGYLDSRRVQKFQKISMTAMLNR